MFLCQWFTRYRDPFFFYRGDRSCTVTNSVSISYTNNHIYWYDNMRKIEIFRYNFAWVFRTASRCPWRFSCFLWPISLWEYAVPHELWSTNCSVLSQTYFKRINHGKIANCRFFARIFPLTCSALKKKKKTKTIVYPTICSPKDVLNEWRLCGALFNYSKSAQFNFLPKCPQNDIFLEVNVIFFDNLVNQSFFSLFFSLLLYYSLKHVSTKIWWGDFSNFEFKDESKISEEMFKTLPKVEFLKF